jgi:hypothetical protein
LALLYALLLCFVPFVFFLFSFAKHHALPSFVSS